MKHFAALTVTTRRRSALLNAVLCCPVQELEINQPYYPHHARYIPAWHHRDIPKRDGHVHTYIHHGNRSRIRKLAMLAIICCVKIPYSGCFSGGKIFVVFAVGKQTTKYLPTKQLPWMQRATPISAHVHVTTNFFPRTRKIFRIHENFTLRKIPAIRYDIHVRIYSKAGYEFHKLDIVILFFTIIIMMIVTFKRNT